MVLFSILMTLKDPNPNFKVTPLFDTEYLRNGRLQHRNVVTIETLKANRNLHT